MRKVVVLISLLVLFLLLEPTPVYKGCGFLNHLIFHFYHANIWHLLGNGLCIYAMKRMNWAVAYVIAVVCSFAIVSPTVGMSGIIFAAIGIRMGCFANVKGLWRCCISAILFGLLPGVSLVFHLLSLLAGFAYGYRCTKYRLRGGFRPSK